MLNFTATKQQIAPPLQRALAWLGMVIRQRLKAHFGHKNWTFHQSVLLPDFVEDKHPLSHFIRTHQLSIEEIFVLLLALAPHIQSNFLDDIIQENIPKAGDFPQLGGVKGKTYRGFLPTGETVLFVLNSQHFDHRFEIQDLFGPTHFFNKKRVLWLEDAPDGEPRMSAKIVLAPDYIDLLTQGKNSLPRFSMKFPAQLIETEMEWEDLILSPTTFNQIRELETYLTYGRVLLHDWGMKKRLMPGYRVLFYGPPGTGKTLTASLLGKYTGKPAFKIDLSMVVSKFIGETEKNLASLFAKAESKDWILFFDEADALFGKRTNVRDAHDKYANQEVSYLLQRVERYDGLVILATNLKSNMDDAFVRRFQSIIQFPFPQVSERLKLWQRAFPPHVGFAPEVSFSSIAGKFELSGAEIMNVVQYACLHSLKRGDQLIWMEDIKEGIKKEFLKEGKILHS